MAKTKKRNVENTLVNVNIKLYDITKCGYYKIRSKEPIAGKTEEIFDQIHNWIKDRTIVQNSTYEVEDNAHLLKAYFLEILKSTSGDYYISIWNEVPTTAQNAVAAISGNVKTEQGKSQMQFKKFGEDYIPGYATYFWVSPLENRLATIRFERSINGHSEFKALVQGFLNLNPNYAMVNKNPEDGEAIIYGYQFDSKKPDSLAFPKFQTCSMKKEGSYEYIKSNISRVSSILGRSVILKDNDESLSIYNKLYSLFCNKNVQSLPRTDFKVKYDIPCELSLSDFKDIYEKWTKEESELDDVGFKIGEDIFWLSHEIQKTDIDLNITKENEELFSLAEIMQEIEQHKAEIINGCKKNS